MRNTTCSVALWFVLLLLSVPALAAPARSAAPEPAGAELSADVEVDPTAYALAGYSVHAGLNLGHWRLDLGAFALSVPEFVHGNKDFDASFNGYGVKVQYFFADTHDGFVLGLDAGHIRSLVQRKGSDLAATDQALSLGVNAGYRFKLYTGLYATPWLGVGYALGSEDITLGGATFEAQPVTIFPAVHLGYAFR